MGTTKGMNKLIKFIKHSNTFDKHTRPQTDMIERSEDKQRQETIMTGEER